MNIGTIKKSVTDKLNELGITPVFSPINGYCMSLILGKRNQKAKNYIDKNKYDIVMLNIEEYKKYSNKKAPN